MDTPAVIEGCYVDLKFLPGLKSARVFVDIPIEYSNQFLKMFDAPDRANPVRVAIARLATAEHSSSGVSRPTTTGPDNALPSVQAPSAESQGQETRRHFRDLPKSQQAALKLQDEEFCAWLKASYGAAYEGWIDADHLLKKVLKITSKRQFDFPQSTHGENWDRLLASYDFRGRA